MYTEIYCNRKGHNSDIKETIQFPENQNTDIAKFCSIIKTLINDMHSGMGAVITQYNLSDDVQFLNYTLCDVLRNLSQTNFHDYSKRYNDFAVVIISYLNLIIMIRHTQADDINTIESELKMCKEDLLLFLFVNKETALNSNICFLNIVAAPNFIHTEKNVKELNPFSSVIGKTILTSEDDFRFWWNNIFLSYITHFIQVENYDNCEFVDMISSTFTHMAMRLDVPTLMNDTEQRIRSLLLSNQQLHAISSPCNKKIIIGGFGSGKSVVAICYIKKLVENAYGSNKIFYIYVTGYLGKKFSNLSSMYSFSYDNPFCYTSNDRHYV